MDRGRSSTRTFQVWLLALAEASVTQLKDVRSSQHVVRLLGHLLSAAEHVHALSP